MKRDRFLIALGSVTCALVWMASSVLELPAGTGEEQMTQQEYVGTSAELPVAFRYPASWSFQEETGRVDIYRAVRLIGPRNGDDTYASSLVVRAAPLKRRGGRHDSLTDMVAAYHTPSSAGGTVLLERARTVAGVSAIELTLSYVIPPLHHRGLVPKEIPVTARVILLEHDERLYEILYSADSREYERFLEAFEQLVDSLRFQEQ